MDVFWILIAFLIGFGCGCIIGYIIADIRSSIKKCITEGDEV